MNLVSFDISDLYYAFRLRHTPTGIQRVQQELCVEMLAHGGMSIVIYDRPLQNWRVVPEQWLRALFDAARAFRASEDSWQPVFETFAAQLSTFPVKDFQSGEWLVNAGTSWSFAGYFAQVRQLRRTGVHLCVFLHDCIPERHPEFFGPLLSIHHSYWLAQLRECADLVMCNSEWTRRDYLELVRPRYPAAVQVCQLNAAWWDSAVSAQADQAAADLVARYGIADEHFVLALGTVEPRKNHIVLFRVWSRLRETHPASCPKLICVGRIGWKSEVILAEARQRGVLDKDVFFLSGVSDEILKALYRRCLFTIYVSLYEGWGLPITESLGAGKLCIAGSNSSLRESGAGLAIHVDERSETDIHDAISRLLDTPDILEAESRRIRAEFRPGSWSVIADRLCGAIANAPPKRPTTRLPQLRQGVIYRFGRGEPVESYEDPQMAEMFCAGRSWHQWEAWGTWTRREMAELAFRVAAPLPVFFLGLRAPPGGAAATIRANGKTIMEIERFEGRRIARVELPSDAAWSDASAEVPIRLNVAANRVQNLKQVEGSKDQRVVGLGYIFIAALDRAHVNAGDASFERNLADELG